MKPSRSLLAEMIDARMTALTGRVMATNSRDSMQGNEISIADMFLAASQKLAQSDARLYRSVDRHLRTTRAILATEDEIEISQTKQLAPALLTSLVPPSFERQTRSSLRELCKQYGIHGYSRMAKPQMIEALRAKATPIPPVPLQALSKAELIDLLGQIL